jgi:hypothetical protein
MFYFTTQSGRTKNKRNINIYVQCFAWIRVPEIFNEAIPSRSRMYFVVQNLLVPKVIHHDNALVVGWVFKTISRFKV